MGEDFDWKLWPDVPRICFGFGEPNDLNACVGFVMSSGDRHLVFAEGYREAATRLYQSAVNGPMLDGIVFPIAFLWRHHVELVLKDIIARGRRLEGEEFEFPATHALPALWTRAEPHIERTGSPDSPVLANVENNVRELDRIDPRLVQLSVSDRQA